MRRTNTWPHRFESRVVPNHTNSQERREVPQVGRIDVGSIRLPFYTGRVTSWVDLTGNAHETMEQLTWKDLTVKGDDATMITELRIQFSQEAFPQPAQDVYVDELKITLNL